MTMTFIDSGVFLDLGGSRGTYSLFYTRAVSNFSNIMINVLLKATLLRVSQAN